MMLSHIDEENVGRIHDALWHPLVLQRRRFHIDAYMGYVFVGVHGLAVLQRPQCSLYFLMYI